MTDKYNLTIHILFWVMLAIFISTAAIAVLAQNDYIDGLFVKTETEVVIEKEPVYLAQPYEPAQDTEWFYFVATGYSANDPEQGTNSTTATGREIQEGMIAVDPNIIPLGTRIEIKDMGYYSAEDTGNYIKGNRIDIYFETKQEAQDFGRRVIWVRALNSNLELADLLSE